MNPENRSAKALIDLDPQETHFVNVPLVRPDGTLGNLRLDCENDSPAPITVDLLIELFDPLASALRTAHDDTSGQTCPACDIAIVDPQPFALNTMSFAANLDPGAEVIITITFKLAAHGELTIRAESTEAQRVIVRARVSESDRRTPAANPKPNFAMSRVCPAPYIQIFGKVAYDAYLKSSGGKSLVSGAPLPLWHDQEPEIRKAWDAAAEAVISAFSPFSKR